MRLFNSPTQTIAADFLRWLEHSIEDSAKSVKKVKSVYYKPSSLNCLRMMYFYRTQTEVDDILRPASALGILESGQDRHLRIQQAVSVMQKQGYKCEWIDVGSYIEQHNLVDLEVIARKTFETVVHHKTLDLLFLCDGLLKINGVYYLLEIKTESSLSFYNRLDVANEHKHQATCYSLAFGIDQVIFIYENRDTCVKKAFLFTVSQALKNEVISLITQCNTAVEQQQIPLRIECKACTYCDYKKKCKALE